MAIKIYDRSTQGVYKILIDILISPLKQRIRMEMIIIFSLFESVSIYF